MPQNRTKVLACKDNQLPIKEFSLNDMVTNPFIYILAGDELNDQTDQPRPSNKSREVITSLLNHFSNISSIIISPRNKDYYSDSFPTAKVYDDYSSTIITDLLKEQEQKYKPNESYADQTILILDDCFWDIKLNNDAGIRRLFFNGRHYNITTIFSSKCGLSLKPEYRCNIDYVFLLENDCLINQNKIWNHFGGIFPTFKSFKLVFSEITKSCDAMVINNRYDDFASVVYWFGSSGIEKEEVKDVIQNTTVSADTTFIGNFITTLKKCLCCI